MENYMNKSVKSVISTFPEVGALLVRFGIGCVTCSMGTCLFKDIIDIHHLPKQEETELMTQVKRIIFPDKETSSPLHFDFTQNTPVKPVRYSMPIRMLVDEHSLIKAFLSGIPKLTEAVERPGAIDESILLKSVDFIRSYADRFHHAKEEDILFKYAEEDSDIIKAMQEEHQTARSYVKAILAGLEEQDGTLIAQNLERYNRLLQQHIKREDEILYPWFERKLSDKQIGEISLQFEDIDRSVGKGFTYKWLTFIHQLDNL